MSHLSTSFKKFIGQNVLSPSEISKLKNFLGFFFLFYVIVN